MAWFREPAGPAGGLPELPEWLCRFRVEDWADEVGPPPVWWDERDEQAGMPWRHFKARLTWQRARRDWERKHGVMVAEVDEQVHAAAVREGTLEALADAAAFMDPEEPDPRWSIG